MVTELGVALFDLAEDQAKWSQATFGTDAERGPIGALKHLQLEAKEAEEKAAEVRAAVESGETMLFVDALEDELRTELADCLLLLLDANRRAGNTVIGLLRAAQAKMVINKARTFPKPTSDVPSQHVKE